MGTHTQMPRTADAVHGGSRSFGRLFLPSIIATTCAISSASAWAGIRQIPDVSAPILTSTAEATPSAPVRASTVGYSISARADDPLAFDPAARTLLLENPSEAWQYSNPAVSTAINNAAPKAENIQPLLIPLPTAMSAGTLGLVALGAFGGARRLRRRIFA